MKVYKEKQFLVFDFEDGKTVKYDFATGETIGKLGKPVKGLQNQLRGISMNYIIESCEDKNYGLFLQFVWDKFKTKGYYYHSADHYITNVGTVLSNVKRYSRYEQIFSAGLGSYLQEGRYSIFKYSINEIPSSLIKYIKSGRVTYLNNDIVNVWSKNPSECCLAYELDYISLNDSDLFCIFQCNTINNLINTYGYNAKSLFLYLDTLKTFEALTIDSRVLGEIEDYARMMSEIHPKYDKYPRNFLTTHAIACRNYNRLKQQFDEKSFQNRRNPKYECKIGKYIFLYPEKIDDIRSEAVSQNNCVASYAQSVIDGKCHILFMRKKEEPDKSLVTIEVKNNKIVQAKGRFNRDLTNEEEVTVEKWNTKFENMKGIAV